ncbi:hypothetical protein F6W96_11500 [Nocardia terpenica]|uniref:Hydrolase n=2 Tax=Nocardia terpenica TaxID=455432 RepID=A0A6G9YZQ5_9NOCA|nr:hypothetical protein F6W96_11500 [Nocardia terpenica]
MVAVTAALTTMSASVCHASAPPDPMPKVTVSLPAPTGSLPVGVRELHLIDNDRPDPWNTSKPRELMVRIWYPAMDSAAAPIARWMPPGAEQVEADELANLGVPQGSWALGPGHSRQDAPARTADGPYPLLLFSPGMDDPAGVNAAQAEDLASHGYVVAAINHTHEAFAVQFPDGRIERTVIPLDSPPQVLSDVLLPVRVADTRFVLDRLADNPDLARILDLSKVGMFGHSLGGSTTVQAMHDDPRIRAGVNLDGPLLGSVVGDGLDRPLLMLGNDNPRWLNRENWEPFWPHNIGVKIPLRLSGTEHMSFNDEQIILPQLTAAGLLSPTITRSILGSVDPNRSIDLQRTYLRAYFDLAFGRTDGDIAGTIEHLAQPGVYLHP